MKVLRNFFITFMIAYIVSGCAYDANQFSSITTSAASTVQSISMPALREGESVQLESQTTEEPTTQTIAQATITSEYDEYMAKSIDLENKIVSSNEIDFDKDGKNEKVQIILDKGYFNEDDKMWSGRGPKWVGYFSFVVYDENKELFSKSINDLVGSNDTIFLYAPEFKISFSDYNKDGKYDFTIGQYYSTNGSEFYLFSIDKTGKIVKLDIEDRSALFISPHTTINSIPLDLENNMIVVSYYDNTEGEYFTDYFKWIESDSKYKLIKQGKEDPNEEPNNSKFDKLIGVFYLGMNYKDALALDLYNTDMQITSTNKIDDDKNAWDYGHTVIWTQYLCCVFDNAGFLYRITVNGDIPTVLGLKNGDSLDTAEKLYGKNNLRYIFDWGSVFEYKIGDYYFSVSVQDNTVSLWNISKYRYEIMMG